MPALLHIYGNPELPTVKAAAQAGVGMGFVVRFMNPKFLTNPRDLEYCALALVEPSELNATEIDEWHAARGMRCTAVDTFLKELRREAERKGKAPEFSVVKQSKFETVTPEEYAPLRHGLWEGRRCFIIGGGPSLKDFDFSLLDGELTIAVNAAFMSLRRPSLTCSIDTKFLSWVRTGQCGEAPRDKLDSGDFLKVFVDTRKPMSRAKHDNPHGNGCIVLPARYEIREGNFLPAIHMTTRLEDGLTTGCNSGFAAVNLALLLGANPIYLLGFDMNPPTKAAPDTHYHALYPTKMENAASVYDRMKRNFEAAAEDIKNRGARVVNLNPNSGLKCFEFGDIADCHLDPDDKPVIVSYYTLGNGYEEHADRLRRSLMPLGFEFDIVGVPDLGSWDKNTHYKADFLLSMMEKYDPRPLLYVDADATFERVPVLLDDLVRERPDFAAHWRGGSELLSGTLWLSNNVRTARLLSKWQNENKLNPKVWDQKNLAAVLKKYKSLKVDRLPPEYCCIFDLMKDTCRNPVIKHWQASRKLKNRKRVKTASQEVAV